MSDFPISSRFKAACSLINNLPVGKFPLILKRICAKIHIKNCEFFTESELSQLTTQFSVSLLDFNDILGACSYAFEQSAYSTIKPDALAATLTLAGMSSEHSTVFSQAWAQTANSVVSNFRDASVMGAPKVMTNNEWSLSINMSNDTLKNTKEASARFEIDLAQPHDGGDEETLAVEFTHEELYGFFQKLEKVQSQLDALS
ncbi:hypothetical protein TrVE_jg245 [Triparma verrucosa]|uniref:COMM domain-containing protein n=1 Tax=Triparma verrucosa TaxID=1606542 RepID=A0A9W7FNL2_9STRA|nr:hypothetical protein TrVE_jg245 [Triparma verrucosa]